MEMTTPRRPYLALSPVTELRSHMSILFTVLRGGHYFQKSVHEIIYIVYYILLYIIFILYIVAVFGGFHLYLVDKS